MWWNGSFQADMHAGLGITLGCVGAPPLLRASMAVHVGDATRVKALGPLLTTILLTGLMDLGLVTFHGDSAHVMCMLSTSTDPADLHMFNCVSLTRDLLTCWTFSAVWHLQEENTICDSLACKVACLGLFA